MFCVWFCFSGNTSGAISLIEQKLKKVLLFLACHHIPEIVLTGVFHAVVAVSSGPDIALFKRLQISWTGIDQKQISPGICDEDIDPLPKEKLNEVLKFVQQSLKVNFHAKYASARRYFG